MKHPLDALTPSEVAKTSAQCRAYAREHGLRSLKFCSISLKEPPRKAVAAFEASRTPVRRQALAIMAEEGTSVPIEAVVQLTDAAAELLSWQKIEGATVPLVPEDFVAKADAIRADPEVIRLCAKYDIDMSEVEVGIWPVFKVNAEDIIATDRQQVQAFLYWCPQDNSNIYAYPLPWVPILDCNDNKVIAIESAHSEDTLPEQCTVAADYAANLFTGEYRTDIKPLDIVQPEGPSFQVEKNVVRWQKWEVRVRFDPREGMILHNITFDHGGSAPRPILHRVSLPEMTVPYADTQPPFHRRQAFDAGDCGFGFCANSLVLGCDCVGHISYLDGVVNDIDGQPLTKEKVICIHEEDAGMLWKHTEMRSMQCETRRARRLVFSTIATLGNYEYSFNWYFYQDGSISFKVKLTGIVATNIASPLDGDNPRYGTLMLPRVVAGYHQHLFVARLDFAVDNPESGEGLVVSEVDCELEPAEGNIHGGAFRPKVTHLTSEKAARRRVDPMKARTWKISNPACKHPITGEAVAYKLNPCTSQLLLAHEGSSVSRAGFGRYSVWVTQNDENRRWPGGDYPLQNVNEEGLPRWVEEDRTITDPVVWHVFGTTHIPRPEDFPIMPVDSVGFQIRPVGFFASNPTLDVPPHINRMSKLHPCCPANHTPRVSTDAYALAQSRRRSSSNRCFTTHHAGNAGPGGKSRLSTVGSAIPEETEADLMATIRGMMATMTRSEPRE